MILEVKSVNTSVKKGIIKTPVAFIELDQKGIAGDAHSGEWHRQISLLGTESIDKFSQESGRQIKYGEFAENITTSGGLLYQMKPFDHLVSDHLILEITQIGKKCHGDNCSVYKEIGNCVMPKEGIFARVIRGGKLKAGDNLIYQPKIYKALVITLSNRASRGEYEDKSGPFLSRLLKDYFEQEEKKIEIVNQIIPDQPDQLEQLVKEARDKDTDLIFTTGGTGIGTQDITPETIRPLLSKEIPGIMEFIRTKYGSLKPAALLSRGIAGVAGRSLVFTLPGSPKAVNEYCSEIFPVLHHAFLMMSDIDAH